jgi:hypothetical protein
MKTSELVEFLKTQPFTDTQAYNLIVGDLFEFMPVADVALPASQRLVEYFMYKIQAVCLATIHELRQDPVKA